MEFYLRIEGVNLDAVLFDTPQISVTRGASFLLRLLTQELPEKLTSWGVEEKLEKITVGASVGVYQFISSDPVALVATIRHNLASDPSYQYFNFVVDYHPISSAQNFQQDLENLVSANRLQQIQLPSLSLADLNIPASEPCAWNGLLPAQANNRVGLSEKNVSLSVAARFEKGRVLRQKFYQTEAGVEFSEENGYVFTQNFEQLSDNPKKGNLNNKVAIIYLDGNKFGRLQRAKCSTKEKQIEFDETVQGYRKTYLANFLRQIKDLPDYQYQESSKKAEGNIENKDSCLRLEVLLWGGDEITLIVPAWCGMHALGFFFEESKNWQFEGTPLTHAGGIVFANRKTPIKKLKDLAYNLAEEVKEASDNSTYNGFDYLVLESLNSPSTYLTKVREDVYGKHAADSRTLLKPIYPDLLNQTEQLQAIPKSALYRIAHNILNDCRISQGEDENTANEVIGIKANKSIERMRTVVGKKALPELSKAEKLKNQLFLSFDGKALAEDHIWSWLHTVELWDYLLSPNTIVKEEN